MENFFDRLVKQREDSADLVDCMKLTVQKLQEVQGTSARKPGIILGKIQSGKTRAFIGTIALAFDRGYDIAIVLTKGTKALAEQTQARLLEDFREFVGNNEMQIFDIFDMPRNLVAWELRQKIVLVAKKQRHNLDRVFKALVETYPELQHRKILIIDDEADYASINFRKDKESGVIEQGKIATMVDRLRSLVERSDFLQVTATPYSLYLQPDDSLPDSGYAFLPKRPAFTVLLPTYKDYIGGDFYFDDNISSKDVGYFVFEEIPIEERDALKKSDGRRFALHEVLSTKAIRMLRKAVMNFIVGACIRQQQQSVLSKPEEHYSFIIHTESAKASHAWQAEVVNHLIADFKRIAHERSDEFYKIITEAYLDLEPSIISAKLQLPTKEEVITKVSQAVEEERIMSTTVNSEIEVKQLLDERGQLKLRTPLNIFIGGQILDRGITVANLIGFYYGRSPQRFQQDTVLQHSRMYGARPLADLAVTRFYTTQNIYDVMKRIHEFDSALRVAFESGAHDKGVYFLRKDERNQIAPCSPNKILLSSITTLRPFKRLVPYGFQTIAPSYLDRPIAKIDDFVKSSISLNEVGPIQITLENALQLLDIIASTIEFEEDYIFDWHSIRATLEYLTKNISSGESVRKVFLLVRRDRDNNRLREGDNRYFDSPDTAHIEGKIAREFAIEAPMLMLFRQNGNIEKGWRGHPFWWPVIVVPSNTKVSIFSDKVAK